MLYVFFGMTEEKNIRELVGDIEELCYQLDPGFSCTLVLPQDPLSIKINKWIIYCIRNLLYAFGSGKIECITENVNKFDLKVGDTYTFAPAF